jgi:hypothetical protein
VVVIDRAAGQSRQADMPLPDDGGRDAVTDRDLNVNANRRSGRQAAVRIGLFLRA